MKQLVASRTQLVASREKVYLLHVVRVAWLTISKPQFSCCYTLFLPASRPKVAQRSNKQSKDKVNKRIVPSFVSPYKNALRQLLILLCCANLG